MNNGTAQEERRRPFLTNRLIRRNMSGGSEMERTLKLYLSNVSKQLQFTVCLHLHEIWINCLFAVK